MGNLNPEDKKILIKIFKVISWLDNKRWNQTIKRSDIFTREIIEKDELQPTQKILAHWLIYITDKRKPVDKLWEKNTFVIKKLIKEYLSKNKEKDVANLCDEFNKKIWAYPDELESIKRTLIILLEYNKDIIYYMTKKLSEWEKKYPEEFISRIAFSLYLLSYKDVGSLARSKALRDQNQEELINKINETRDILNDAAKFDDAYQKWKKYKWHKRLWAAIRDYKKDKKLMEIFINGITSDADKEVWKRDFTKQLELPGDIWNETFFDNCIKQIAKRNNIKGNISKVIRHLWEEIKFDCPESYPEQFDVSFDFAPRMCEKDYCDICPFGPNGAKLICIPSEDKYCPVALISCGYIAKCEEQDRCVIIKGVGKGICSENK